MLTISQILVLCLIAIAEWVAVGLMQKKVMWKWIVLYWAVLTVKNGEVIEDIEGTYTFDGETVLVKDTLDAFDGDVKQWCNTRIASISSSDVKATAIPR